MLLLYRYTFFVWHIFTCFILRGLYIQIISWNFLSNFISSNFLLEIFVLCELFIYFISSGLYFKYISLNFLFNILLIIFIFGKFILNYISDKFSFKIVPSLYISPFLFIFVKYLPNIAGHFDTCLGFIFLLKS